MNTLTMGKPVYQQNVLIKRMLVDIVGTVWEDALDPGEGGIYRSQGCESERVLWANRLEREKSIDIHGYLSGWAQKAIRRDSGPKGYSLGFQNQKGLYQQEGCIRGWCQKVASEPLQGVYLRPGSVVCF